MSTADTIVNRAINVALFNKRSDINSNVLRASLDAIADDWPKREDAGMLNLYLVHDCRSLAKALNAIADAAEAWDEDEDEERARMLALANTPEAQQARDDDFGGVQRG